MQVYYSVKYERMRPRWSWPYGSWIYSCLCNQFLSPLNLWIRILFMARCT